MQLIDFDFRTIVLSILFFIGGCLNIQPPEPVSVITPKSVTTESKKNTAGLTIELLTNETLLTYEPKSTDSNIKGVHQRLEKRVKSASVGEIKNFIEKAIKMNGSSKAQFPVMLIGDDKVSAERFQKVIQALKEKEIFRFQLITTPE